MLSRLLTKSAATASSYEQRYNKMSNSVQASVQHLPARHAHHDVEHRPGWAEQPVKHRFGI